MEKDLGAKCEIIMLIDVVTAGKTNDFSFFCDRWIKRKFSKRKRGKRAEDSKSVKKSKELRRKKE